MQTKPKINLSLNMSYHCNFRCSFCYLTPEQLGDTTRIPLDVLEQRLDEVLVDYHISHIDLYGGEPLLLPQDYLFAIRDMLLQRGIDDIVLITNLSLINDVVADPAFEISVSYDFSVREKHEKVLENMFLLPNRYNVLTLASREFLDTVSVDEYVDTMNLLNQMKGCEIKPYSGNQANNDDVKFTEFEDFVWAVIKHPKREFYFENRTLVKEAVEDKTRNAYSDDHLYITPTGAFAVLEFDQNDREFFLEVDGIPGYRRWCEVERQRVQANLFCSSCPFSGGCLSEHLREVKSLDNSCNGFINLLDKWTGENDEQ